MAAIAKADAQRPEDQEHKHAGQSVSLPSIKAGVTQVTMGSDLQEQWVSRFFGSFSAHLV
jgi:hypothetical protein